MENVWNIRDKKGLFYLLPEEMPAAGNVDCTDAAVIACIYYEDTVQRYLDYIKAVPAQMAVYLISSNENTLKELRKFSLDRKKTYVIEKKNRGRDISALVISGREIFQQYEYVCFVHDKKEKSEFEREMVDFWIENLWGNMLKTEGYIRNVLQVFADNPSIGMLAPPEPYCYMHQIDFWSADYPQTRRLAEELGLTNTVIEEKYQPITLGTVFWCRSCVMKKLFEKKWQYEDFVDEPMPTRNTISHAVERILAYLAQDAGYETGTILSETYARELLISLIREKREVYDMLDKGIDVSSPLYLRKFYARKEQIKKYVSENGSIYLFGAGKVGRCYATALKEMIGCCPKAFLVTDGGAEGKNIGGIPVMPYEDFHMDNSAGIIVGVGRKRADEIKTFLENRKYTEYLCLEDLPVDEDCR